MTNGLSSNLLNPQSDALFYYYLTGGPANGDGTLGTFTTLCPGASAAYGTNLVKFINDVRLTYATNQPYGTNLPFFLSRISANQTVYSNPADPDYPKYLVLRAGQEYASTNLSDVFMLDTDAAKFSAATPWSGSGLHFDTQGQQSLGAAFGQAVVRALPPQLLLPEG